MSRALDRFFYRPDEEESGLLDLSAASGETPSAIPEEPLREYIAFWLAGECYAVPIASLREIVKVPSLTEIPRAPENLLGVMNLRGEVMPVYDVKKRLRLIDHVMKIAGPEAANAVIPRGARVLVMNAVDGPWGVIVDAVTGVVRLKASTLETPPQGLRGERDCIVGLGRRKEQLFILLDLERALQ
ncbi:MAG: chemotaxis protein CheW [Myxococcaceae bacterium]